MAGQPQEEVFEADVIVRDAEGIHLRSAAALVRAAARFPKAELLIKKDDQEVNGKSIMGVLTLVAERGSHLHFRARGEGAKALLETLVAMFQPSHSEVQE